MKQRIFLQIATGLLASTALLGQNASPALQSLGREILAELISYRSAAGHNQVEPLARELMRRFLAAGFPEEDVLFEAEPPGAATLIVRYRGDGSGEKPILLLAHMDVVDALPTDWSRDPYRLIEEDGYLYGRGTLDNKGGVAALSTNFLWLKQQGWVPRRDLILALTGDEETGMLSARSLVSRHRDLTAAEFALNADAGGGFMDGTGKPLSYVIQAAEKTYATFVLTVRNRGGHSSQPRADNAIYELVDALQKLRDFQFPVQTNEITIGYFKESGDARDGELGEAMRRFAADPGDERAARILAAEATEVGITRTTCVATMLEAGHAENALPQTARATVNCRIFPGTPVEEVKRTLQRTVRNDGIEITVVGTPTVSPASPLREDVMKAVTETVRERFPGLRIIPYMSAYGTDGSQTRSGGIPTYGVAGLFVGPDDERSHGRDERIAVSSFNGALDHWQRLLEKLAGGRKANNP